MSHGAIGRKRGRKNDFGRRQARMKKADKYLEALKNIDGWVIVSDWAKKFAEMYPDELAKAEEQAKNQKNDTTGLREIAARISSRLSTGGFDKDVEIDDSERPRKVRYISKDELEAKATQEVAEDLEPITRKEIEARAENKMALHELYRLDEFRNIQKAFKSFFNIDFELDHAKALLNPNDSGEHHPDNFQLLFKYHNARKNNANWQRFTLDEQIAYIRKALELHSLVAERMEFAMDVNVLESLLERLKRVY